MKKAYIIITGVIAVLFLTLLLTPVFLKGKIQAKVKKELDNSLNARVQWEKFSVSWMYDFPSFTTSFTNLKVFGINKFSNDTLLASDEVVISVNFFDVLKGEDIKINSVSIKKPSIHIIQSADSLSNLNIFKKELADKDLPNRTQGQQNGVSLNEVKVIDGEVYYNDYKNGWNSVVKGFNLSIQGDESIEDKDVVLSVELKGISIGYRNTKFLENADFELQTELLADKRNHQYTFKENKLRFNRLEMGIEGSCAFLQDGCDVNLVIQSKNSSFSSVFDLFPKSLMEKYGNIESDGSFVFNTSVRGIYDYKNTIPEFHVNMEVDSGSFKFEKQTENIHDVNFGFKIDNAGHHMDSTLISLNKFHFAIADKPFDASIKINHPFSAVNTMGEIKGILDFDLLQKAIPVNDIKIGGLVNSNLSFKGSKQQVKENKYDELTANGTIQINDLVFQNKYMPHKLSIIKGGIEVKPNQLELNEFAFNYSQSDLILQGIIQNYLSYLFSDGILYANLKQKSNVLVVEDFMNIRRDKKAKEKSGDSDSDLPIIYKDLDCVVKMNCTNLNYDKLEAKNLQGTVRMKDGVLSMEGLNMNLLNGGIQMSGTYSTKDILKPGIDLDFKAKSIDLKETANSFGFVQKLLPGANNTTGKVDLKFVLQSDMYPSVKLIDKSIQGNGQFIADDIEIKDSKVFENMAELLNDDKYKVLKVEKVKIDFEMGEGMLKVKPFTAEAFDKKFEIKGEHGFDKSLNYVVTAPVTGNDVAKALGFPSVKVSNKEYPVDVLIGGNADEPKVDLDFSKAQKQMEKDLSKNAENVINDLLKDDKVKKSISDFFKGL